MRQQATSTAESLGARIVRLAAQSRTPVPPRSKPRPEHEYVKDRAKALAVIREHVDTRAELAQKLGRIEGAVIGFALFRIKPKPRAGGGSWPVPDLPRDADPPKRRGRPGRRGRLVAALARSRSP